MKIFFTAPIKGGQMHQPELKAIVTELNRYGEVHAPHFSDTAISHYGETGIPDKEIFARELKALADADLVVAEVTTPGLGIGYLLSRAVVLNKKVLALYRGDNTLNLSSMIKGDPGITILLYRGVDELTDLIETHVPN